MSARVKRIEVLEVDLPFKKPFKHALKTRNVSNSVFVKIHLENGTTGYGESLPREYVTNETVDTVFSSLEEALPKTLIGARFSDFKEAKNVLNKLDGAAKCCVEIALLDALGRCFKKSVCRAMAPPTKRAIFASGILSADSLGSMAKKAIAMRIFGFKAIKVKVGTGDDIERLKLARKILGNKISIRVDANCAWSADEAIDKINRMRRFRISCVEQPVKSDDYAALKKVTDSVPEMIMADESISSIKDAQTLASLKACNAFNVRLSKCGGMSNSLRIADIARRNSIAVQAGCQVGESGVLSAAGAAFAGAVGDIEYFEGSYGKLLLKEDITKENMTMGFGGRVKTPSGPGLGVTVVDRVLEKYTSKRITIE